MKICPYCGKENPDDATVCSVDQTRLDPDALAESPRPKNLVDMAARPFTAIFAVQLLAADTVFGLILDITGHQWYLHRFPHSHYSTNFYLSTVWTYGIVVLFLYLIYRGKNWARWVASCVLVLGIIAAPFMTIGHLHWIFYFNTLIIGVAIVALFQRPSNEWYKGSKKILSDPVPAV